jgi:phage terminase small subunit
LRVFEGTYFQLGEHMPRKSAQELNLTVIDVQAQRLRPPDYLKKEEKAIFEHVVGNSAPQHFKQNELPLLAQYCTAVYLARWYSDNIGEEGRDDGRYHQKFVESARLSASLATKLRLTPSSRYDARQADRYSSGVIPDDVPRPWDRRAPRDGDDE